jgi:hypothetical protein
MIDRRQFLRLSAAGAAAVAVIACARDDTDDARLAQPGLLGVLGPDVVRDLGKRYREVTPSENDAKDLRAAIAGSRLFPRTSIEERVKADFAEGRTVVVNGWLLSATEARQCALYSLTPA